MEGSFLAQPTDVYVSYLAKKTDRAEFLERRLLHRGRLAMAMELITVMRLLEQHDLLSGSREETCSVLQTLLVDQELAEEALELYERLAEWRKIKLLDDVSGAVVHASQPSERGTPRGT